MDEGRSVIEPIPVPYLATDTVPTFIYIVIQTTVPISWIKGTLPVPVPVPTNRTIRYGTVPYRTGTQIARLNTLAAGDGVLCRLAVLLVVVPPIVLPCTAGHHCLTINQSMSGLKMVPTGVWRQVRLCVKNQSRGGSELKFYSANGDCRYHTCSCTLYLYIIESTVNNTYNPFLKSEPFHTGTLPIGQGCGSGPFSAGSCKSEF